ncbi:MAG: NDP-sugar synthase [Haloarculaceae archaeon]|uniref:NDP-sugar synthase n=1 Tax=Salinibaculum salinum TaxID=3131996 RepID=UPI002FC53EAE
MKAVVLAGGYATRLWPVTRHRPKMLLPVGETTVIDTILSQLEADDRIDDVFVSTNERFAEDFRDHVAETGFEKPQLSVEDTTDEDEKFGVVGALAQLVEREGIADEDLLVIAGDNLISFDVADFLDFFEEQSTPTLAAYDVGSREKAKSYGLVELDGDRVVDFQEKPDDPPSTLVSIACYAFPAESVRFGEYLADGNNPDEPGWFIQWLVEHSEVHAFTFDGAWFDIGTPESYLEAVEWALDGDSIVAQSATVEDTEIGENVHIMADATVHSADLDRSLVFPGATVADSTVRDSIIDSEATVHDLDLSGALIGSHSRISNGE